VRQNLTDAIMETENADPMHAKTRESLIIAITADRVQEKASSIRLDSAFTMNLFGHTPVNTNGLLHILMELAPQISESSINFIFIKNRVRVR
jgi:hypothetical protein